MFRHIKDQRPLESLDGPVGLIMTPTRELATQIHKECKPFLKALNLRGGQANVIGHVDRVLAMLAAGVLDPTPLVTRHMKLEEAPEAYAVYDRREALKIVLTP